MKVVLFRRALATLVTVGLVATLASCAPVSPGARGPRSGPMVVTTTGILADLVRNVGGDGVEVVSLVPEGADPHSYEPSLRNVRDIVYADLAFSNYLLLEEHSIIRSLDANLPDGVPNVSLAESATKYAARVIPLVENVSLDTVWLGFRVSGSGSEYGADRTSQVQLSATDFEGPGQLTAYLTETFGSPRVYFDSADGASPGAGGTDTMTLPLDAHTHMSWTFGQAGIYRLDLEAVLEGAAGKGPVPLAVGTITFAVGVDPDNVPGMAGAEVLGAGHADVSVDVDSGEIMLAADTHAEGHHEHHLLDPADTVVEVPNKALSPIPRSPEFRFLGRPGDSVFQLPQAVLGRHVHGEIDPHLWHDPANAIAYVQVIRDHLIDVDPEREGLYRANAAAYIEELHELDAYMEDTIGRIEPHQRNLITTHDAFGYLATTYDLDIVGFVTPNPATEPSLAERRRLSETIRNLDVPAVFVEPTLAQRSSVLTEVAAQHGIRVCPIHGDAFTREVATYVDMMRANADSLHECLAKKPVPVPLTE